MKNLLSYILLFSIGIINAQEKQTIYYPNGNKHYDYEMKNGLLTGGLTCYYENGSIMMKGSLDNNQKAGEWKVWDRHGILREVRNYKTGNQFQIINEWDEKNNQILPGIVDEKNNRATQAVNISVLNVGHVLTNRRLWVTIKKGKPVNDFLFLDNHFLNALANGVNNKEFSIFEDDRFVNVKNSSAPLDLKNANVVEYRIKEDISYYQEQKTLRRRIIGICPVIQDDCAAREAGWLYWPDVFKTLSAKEDLQLTLSNLTSQVFSGIIYRDTFKATDRRKWTDVKPGDSLLIELSLLEAEAGIWIFQVDQGS
jgi:hypothetical protein